MTGAARHFSSSSRWPTPAPFRRPMTQRLYYTDPYARSFDAVVTAVESSDGRAKIFLDRTAFYPTSGGQPIDTGTLGGFRVAEVVDEDDGRIAHLLDQGPDQGPDQAPGTKALGPAVDQTVRGEFDWLRRFDHMQQHTGQLVLSAAFARLFDAHTVSFHLGAEA